jgi:hypothetical protein
MNVREQIHRDESPGFEYSLPHISEDIVSRRIPQKDQSCDYPYQELMDFLSVRNSFDEAALSLKKFFGLDIRASRFEVIS